MIVVLFSCPTWAKSHGSFRFRSAHESTPRHIYGAFMLNNIARHSQTLLFFLALSVVCLSGCPETALTTSDAGPDATNPDGDMGPLPDTLLDAMFDVDDACTTPPCQDVQCYNQAQCTDGQYCAKPSCGPATLGACKAVPSDCPSPEPQAATICGCDGKPYASTCEAARAGESWDDNLSCTDITCGSNVACGPFQYCKRTSCSDVLGQCEDRPPLCIHEPYAPVCTCLNQSFGNACSAALAGQNVALDGICGANCPPEPTCQIDEIAVDTDGDTCPDACLCGDGSVPTVPDGCTPVSPTQTLCLASGGLWDPLSCGAYECGVRPPPCPKFTGGCNCGETSTFKPLVGCSPHTICPPVSCQPAWGYVCDPKFSYCDFQGSCGFADDQGVCIAKPTYCSTEGTPVCGCNDETYVNDCERRKAGISKFIDGACPNCNTPICDLNEYVEDTNGDGCLDTCFCATGDLPDPVSGCEPIIAELCNQTGGTWMTDSCGYLCGEPLPCAPGQDGGPACQCPPGRVFTFQDGCVPDATCSSPDCGASGISCEGLTFCEPPEGTCSPEDTTAVCVPIALDCEGTTANTPVCDCNGVTWDNDCLRRMFAHVGKLADGPCADECSPEPQCAQTEALLDSDNDGCLDSCVPLTLEACSVGANECSAAGANETYFCAPSTCVATDGVCTLSPQTCDPIPEPVCGCDHKTYSSACVAAQAGVIAETSGPCP